MAQIIFSVLVLIGAVVAFGFVLSGAPYLPSKPEMVRKMVKISGVKKGEKMVDVGSGDGRLVIAFAKAGAEAHGFEINPILIWMSRRNIRKAKLQGKAFIHSYNFWYHDFSKFDIVVLFQMPHLMKKIGKKMKKELKKGARVICNSFYVPGWKHDKKDGYIQLYKM